MKHWLATLLLLVPVLTLAGAAGVNILTTKAPADQVYDRVYQALEGAKFWVVFEADMGSRMDQLATERGSDAKTNSPSSNPWSSATCRGRTNSPTPIQSSWVCAPCT